MSLTPEDLWVGKVVKIRGTEDLGVVKALSNDNEDAKVLLQDTGNEIWYHYEDLSDVPAGNHIQILVAVDNEGRGYILDWDGDKGRLRTEGTRRDNVSIHEAFTEEVQMMGRMTEDHEMDHPKDTGLYLFDGNLIYHFEGPDGLMTTYEGKWKKIYVHEK